MKHKTDKNVQEKRNLWLLWTEQCRSAKARVRVVVVNDMVVEVCCSVVIMDGVEKDDELVMEVSDGVKTEVTGRRYGLLERM